VRIEPGRVAVVTGGASGIGFALPAAVVTTLAADVSEPGDIERLAQTAFALGPVQLVCLNAGIVSFGGAWRYRRPSGTGSWR
jgi:NAD(P)-dependent dehydrogenase (short-subunit alcohol dehydrogenase family)